MLLSCLGFACMAAMVKLASHRGLPLMEILAARALVSLVISYVDVRRRGVSLRGKNPGLLMARAVVGTLTLVCVYYSMTTLPLAEATVLQYLYPMFTALIALMFLGERVAVTTVICVALSVLGLLVMVQPLALLDGQLMDMPPQALTAAIMGALGSAVAYVLVRRLSQQGEDASLIILYFPAVALPFSLILLGGDAVWPQGWDWGVLLLVGIFTQIGQLGLTWAMRTETASKATAYAYIQVLFAALLGWCLFEEVPGLWTVLGGALILLGAMVNLWKPKRAQATD